MVSLDGVTPLPTGQDAWLVWEGNAGMTYLVRGTPQDAARRSLVTLNRDDVKRVEILGYDRILAKISLVAHESASIDRRGSARRCGGAPQARDRRRRTPSWSQG